MSGEKFPSEMNLIIIDSLYKNYTLGFDEDEDVMHIFCETCNDIVGTVTKMDVGGMEDDDLYETILDAHEPL